MSTKNRNIEVQIFCKNNNGLRCTISVNKRRFANFEAFGLSSIANVVKFIQCFIALNDWRIFCYFVGDSVMGILHIGGNGLYCSKRSLSSHSWYKFLHNLCFLQPRTKSVEFLKTENSASKRGDLAVENCRHISGTKSFIILKIAKHIHILISSP